VIPERHCEGNAGEKTAEEIVQGFKVQKFNRFRRVVGRQLIAGITRVDFKPAPAFQKIICAFCVLCG
jgi:hypothetical protein